MNARAIGGTVLLVLGGALVASGVADLAGGAGGLDPGPTATATRSPAASAANSAAPSATLTPTPTPTPTAAPTAAPSPTLGEDAVRAFFADLEAAIRAGTMGPMTARLNGAVIDRYGTAACETSLASVTADATYTVEIATVAPLGPWDYVTDGRSTAIPAAWSVTASVTANGTTTMRDLHVAPQDGAVSWFTDCGDPLP